MKAEKTISTHVSGDARARRHNKRDREVTDLEPHIDPNGYHETLVDESTVHAYHRLFDPAVEEYNARQTRADRKIKNYHAKVEADPRKHTCYEMTVCVGNKDNPVDRDLGYTIMREYVDEWKDRNPNLELIGAYYHADEEGVPGWHLDFIPVGHGFKNGPSVQTALSRALVEQGFGYVKGRSEDGLRQTPQIQWERSENDTLEAICNKYGVKVEHPERGKDVKHLATPDYKELQDEVHELKSQVEQQNGELEKTKSEKLTVEQGYNQVEQEVDDIVKSLMPKESAEEEIKLPLRDKIVYLDRHIHHDRRETKRLNEELPKFRKELHDLQTRNLNLEIDNLKLESDIQGKQAELDSKQAELDKINSGASEALRKANEQKEQADDIVAQIPEGLEEINTVVEDISKAVMDASGSLKENRRRSDNIDIVNMFDEKRGLNGRIKHPRSVEIRIEDYKYLKDMAGKAESLMDVPDSMKEIADRQNQLETSVKRYLTPIDDLVEEEAEEKEKELQEKLEIIQNRLNISEYHNQRLGEENDTLNTELSSYKAIKQAFPDKVKALEDEVSRSWTYDEPSGHGAR